MFKELVLFCSLSVIIVAQQQNKAGYIEYKNEFMKSVEKEAEAFNKTESPAAKSFKMEFDGIKLPQSKDEFTQYWHSEPVNQGITGTCWSFSTTSFIESEIFRLYKEKVKLSPLFTVYWEYLEKARGFVQSRGRTTLGEGSQANALFRCYVKNGAVPESVYSGKLPGQKVYDHRKMFEEIQNYLKSVQTQNAWDEKAVESAVKSILNHYLGEPPVQFSYDGKTYTPQQFYKERIKINFEDYIALVSFTDEPYFTMMEYKVPDNWWHSKEYFNLPLGEYMGVLKKAIRTGFTLCFAGDVSEPGIHSQYKAAVVPTFDIPSAYINADARQLRFVNGTTSDDHGIHVVGYKEDEGKDWYLIKDSGSGSFNKGDKGYYFFHEDFVKLKMLGIIVHKDAIGDLLNKVPAK
ncbi:MAG: peptidase C1 [Ignavibacteriales bacterium]|nr:peptidase C1 [Ignavibacteriales bacterium]